MGAQNPLLSAIPYGWYIEMWIGLFLLTPFLNILYRHIPNQKQKLVLLGTLFLITALPDWTNRYGLHLVPEFWVNCFPLFFYFAGAYIREYQPSISKYGGGWPFLVFAFSPLFSTRSLSKPLHDTNCRRSVRNFRKRHIHSLLSYILHMEYELPACKKMLAGISKPLLTCTYAAIFSMRFFTRPSGIYGNGTARLKPDGISPSLFRRSSCVPLRRHG